MSRALRRVRGLDRRLTGFRFALGSFSQLFVFRSRSKDRKRRKRHAYLIILCDDQAISKMIELEKSDYPAHLILSGSEL